MEFRVERNIENVRVKIFRNSLPLLRTCKICFSFIWRDKLQRNGVLKGGNVKILKPSSSHSSWNFPYSASRKFVRKKWTFCVENGFRFKKKEYSRNPISFRVHIWIYYNSWTRVKKIRRKIYEYSSNCKMEISRFFP